MKTEKLRLLSHLGQRNRMPPPTREFISLLSTCTMTLFRVSAPQTAPPEM